MHKAEPYTGRCIYRLRNFFLLIFRKDLAKTYLIGGSSPVRVHSFPSSQAAPHVRLTAQENGNIVSIPLLCIEGEGIPLQQGSPPVPADPAALGEHRAEHGGHQG